MSANQSERQARSRAEVEAPKAPSYLQPTVALVNATLGLIHDGLPQETVAGGGVSEAQISLRAVLSGITYDGVQTTATDVHRNLLPFITQDMGSVVDSRFKRFDADLEYIGLLEKGGLVTVNKRLKELFDSLGTEHTTEEKVKRINKLNDLLGRAIYLFPHLATGIEVKLKPGAEAEGSTEAFQEKFGLNNFRHKLTELQEQFKKEKGEPLPNTLIVPLPYGDTSSTREHGSGKRNAQDPRSITLGLELLRRRIDDYSMHPVLGVRLGFDNFTYFEPNEIEYLQFADNGDLTPKVFVIIDVHTKEMMPILSKTETPVTNYLGFREFANTSDMQKEKLLGKGLSDAEMRIVKSDQFRHPRLGNLWETFSRDGVTVLDVGFLALVDIINRTSTLYEFSGIENPAVDIDDAGTALYINMTRGIKPVLSYTKTFTGDAIMERLVQIPVK